MKAEEHPLSQKQFAYFPNHGDDEGRNCFTVGYGDPNELDFIITGAEDNEDDATEICKRLNGILSERVLKAEQELGEWKEKHESKCADWVSSIDESAARVRQECERLHKIKIQELEETISVIKKERDEAREYWSIADASIATQMKKINEQAEKLDALLKSLMEIDDLNNNYETRESSDKISKIINDHK